MQVPLVLYYQGRREEVGKAIIQPDGSVAAQIQKDIRKELKDIILPVTALSIEVGASTPVVLKEV